MSTPTDPLDLAALRRMCDLLMPPWEQLSGRYLSVDRGESPQVFRALSHEQVDAIIAAVNTLPRLLDLAEEVKRLKVTCAVLEADLANAQVESRLAHQATERWHKAFLERHGLPPMPNDADEDTEYLEMRAMAEDHGVQLVAAENRIADLESQLARVTRERDEARALQQAMVEENTHLAQGRIRELAEQGAIDFRPDEMVRCAEPDCESWSIYPDEHRENCPKRLRRMLRDEQAKLARLEAAAREVVEHGAHATDCASLRRSDEYRRCTLLNHRACGHPRTNPCDCGHDTLKTLLTPGREGTD